MVKVKQRLCLRNRQDLFKLDESSIIYFKYFTLISLLIGNIFIYINKLLLTFASPWNIIIVEGDGNMDEDYLKKIDSLFGNNKELINKLTEEKRLLESLFLDNRIPEEFKKDLLEPYNTLTEVIDKRVNIYRFLKESKEVPNLVGLLYNESQQNNIKSILKNLQELSERRKINIICFNLRDVNIQDGLVEGLLIVDSSITHRTVSIPKCTINIGYYSKSENINKVKQMYMMYDSIVVNPVNIFNQAVVFDVLSAIPDIKDCILPVSTLSPSILSEYLINSNMVFLLPERGLYNNVAIRIEKHSQNEKDNCSIETGSSRQYCSENDLYACIKKMIGNKKYVAVQGKKALLWNDAPLEARVYVQKGITGKWSVTKMISKNEIFLKDSIYKDTVDELEKTLLNIIPDKIGDIMQSLESYSLNICSYLEYYFLHLGNCTVDFIIDSEGKTSFIGFGGWDKKNYLFKLNGNHVWDKYIANSIDYLIYLENTEKQDGRFV